MTWLDRIHLGDARELAGVPDASVDLVVTSPPFNIKKDYGRHKDDLPLQEFQELLQRTWAACYRVLKPGGRLCVNVANTGRDPLVPLGKYTDDTVMASAEGWVRKGEIIWDKGASVGDSTAWGSYCLPTSPALRDQHEVILVFGKGKRPLARPHPGARADITKAEFQRWTLSVWQFPTVQATRKGHPAPFPRDLPRRLIKLYTFPGAVVLDPFVGSGTTCAEAKFLGRHWVGFDIEPRWVRLADVACAQEVMPMAPAAPPEPREKLVQLALPGLAGKRQRRTAGVR